MAVGAIFPCCKSYLFCFAVELICAGGKNRMPNENHLFHFAEFLVRSLLRCIHPAYVTVSLCDH